MSEKGKEFDIKVGENTYSFKEIRAKEYLEELPAGMQEVIRSTVRCMVKASQTNTSYNAFLNLPQKEFMCLYQQYAEATSLQVDKSFLEKK